MTEVDFQPLDQLATRAPDDLSMALIDACATVSDVLAFYQEYIANEGFLRTATERRSILELARTVGYELAPGAAATTRLAFSVQEPPQQSAPPGTPGAFPMPTRASIPVGTKVQSIPQDPGEVPQTFETIEAIDARYEWNSMVPRTSRRQVLTVVGGQLKAVTAPDGSSVPVSSLYLSGVSTGINANDVLIVVVDSTNLDPNDPLDAAVQSGVVAVTVAAIAADPLAQVTRVDLVGGSSGAAVLPFTPPAPPYVPVGTVDATPTPFGASVAARIFGSAYDEGTLTSLIGIQGWDEDQVLTALQGIATASRPPASAYVLRQRVGFFGHNAPTYASLHPSSSSSSTLTFYEAQPLKSGKVGRIIHWWPPSDPSDWDTGRTIWQNTTQQLYADHPTAYLGMQAFLERSVSQVKAGDWIALQSGSTLQPFQVTATADVSLTEFNLTGKATGIALAGWSSSDAFGMRTTTAFVQSDPLALAQLPLEPTISAGASTITLDGLVFGLSPGKYVGLSGQGPGATGSGDGLVRTEMLVISSVVHTCGFTSITFTTGLANSYALSTLTLNANVADGSHGETVANEILGSGNGTQINQTWTLSRSPVTYLASAAAGGAVSTVQVTVNGVASTEVPSLYEQPSAARVHTLRNEDKGTTDVGFGDGDQGARLPTGTANVLATYRVGLGPAGNVASGALAILQSRPLGVKGVTNPVAASGGQAAETLDDARTHAPITTRTFDRIVSLDDYGDFASTFPGIGKASAVPVWSGRERVVHVTVGSATGGPVAPSDQQLLLAAMLQEGDPTLPVQVDTYVARSFKVTASLIVDPAYDLDSTKTQAAAALGAEFNFAQRSFGQSATEAEVMTALLSVPGVVACNVTTFVDPSLPVGPASDVIAGHPAHFDASRGVIVPADLLLLDPLGPTLTATHAS
jgi:predicted phage baseplate assembly protein